MDKQRIFKLAIRKAIENGWDHFVGEDTDHFREIMQIIADYPDRCFDDRDLWAAVLYDNEFCRKSWGVTYVVPIGKLWIYHRSKMLFSSDPFWYISRYLQ